MIGGTGDGHPYDLQIISLVLSCIPIVALFALMLASWREKMSRGAVPAHQQTRTHFGRHSPA